MFGFITRTEHDRVVAERDDALALVHKLTRERDAAQETLGLERRARANLQERLAKLHTTRGPDGRLRQDGGSGMKVYRAIAAVQGEMARDGISKDRRNSQQGYNFRGIDDVFNALSPLLSKHGLCILPRCIERTQVERTSAKGGALFYTSVDVEFDFVSAEDGSKHTIRVPGEAMDSADKSTNKAMSAAYKYAAMQAFCIPTEGDNDADATTHEVTPRQSVPRHDPTPAQITDEQRHQIMTLANAKNIDARTICEKAGIDAIKNMPAAWFDKAMAWLAKQPKRELEPAGGPQSSTDLSDDIPY